jgi:glycosyltransferase involved in cell wall biosynthesis
MVKIGIYLGSSSENPQNIEKELIAWGKSLNNHQTELFGSTQVPESVEEYFEYYQASTGKYQNPISKIRLAFKQTREYIQNADPDILIQFWCYPTHGPGLTAAAKVSGTTSIARFPGDHFGEYDVFAGHNRILAYGLHNIIGRFPLHLADKIITLGPHGSDEVTRRGADYDDVHILPPAAGVEERFSPTTNKERVRKKLGIPVEDRVFLYVGRLSMRKGMVFLQDIIEELQVGENISFVLVGSGEYQQKFKQVSQEVNIITPGYVDYQDIHEYYKAADVYVHPSPYEGIPLSILEALNCELPVVARNAGDIPFVIENVVDSPTEMADILNSSNYRVHWKNKRMFSHEYHTQKIKSIIEEVRI